MDLPPGTTTPLRQGTRLVAKTDFRFGTGKGRAVMVRTGQKFWVTNSQVDQAAQKLVLIDRAGKGSISNGYAFSPAMVDAYFHVEAR